ncbi:MAG: T9SS type A sorting domain-containing protein [Chitinophagaceae bacterium]|nr:T9SS type A sorting domain-containing protein [Chitinophagaceae bacterium]
MKSRMAGKSITIIIALSLVISTHVLQAQDTWTQVANFGGTARYGAVGFSIGSKGYIGTGYDTGYKNDFWQYDPATDSWTQKADFGGSARYFAVGFSIDSKGYIGTGDDGSYTKDFWEYDPANNTWTKKANFGGSARYWSTGFSIGSKGYIGLGNNNTDYKNDFWQYDPATNSWLQKANFGGTARGAATGFSIGEKGYIGTGYDGSYKKDFWEYDPTTNLWTQKANYGGVSRYEAVGFSIGSKGYTGTGSNGSLKSDFWEYTPANDTWTEKSSFDGTARYRAVGFSIENKGYIGTGFDNANKKDFWQYTPEQCFGLTVYADADSDSYGDAANSYFAPDCVAPTGYSINGTDCNDSNSGIHPGSCDGSNGVDDDCDGTIDDGSGAIFYYVDGDGDGYGAGTGSFFCSNPGAGYSTNKTDCNDSNSAIHPGLCDGSNGLDDNCDGTIDDGSGAIIYYADEDGDGYGGGTGTSLCNNPGAGYSTNNTDCNDSIAAINSGAVEIANGIDDDCNGNIDDGNFWTQKVNFEGIDRVDAVGFSIGLKGYLGMGYNAGYYKDFWEYDPVIHIWTQKADFGGAARSGAVGFSIGSKGYLGNGAYFVGEASFYYKDFWEYDPELNTWTQKSDFEGIARYSAVGFSISNKGYIGTGNVVGNYYKDFWEYDPAVNIWTQKADFGGTTRYEAVGFSIGSKGYLGTGVKFGNITTYYKDFWEYDPAVNTWTQKADFGGTARRGAVGFSIGSKGYLGTGYNNSIKYKDFWEYDPVTDTWSQKSDFGGTARHGAVGFSIGNKGFLGTGQEGYPDYNVIKDFWEYIPEVTVSACAKPVTHSSFNIIATSAKLKWLSISQALSYKLRYKSTETSEWILTKSIDNHKTLHGLTPNTEYTWQVKSFCDIQPVVSSDWSEKQFFTTDDLRLSDADVDEMKFSVYPNPLSSSATVSFFLTEESNVTIELMDVNGRSLRVIAHEDFSAGTHEVTFNRESLVAGIYFLQTKTNAGVMMKTVVIE